MSADALTHGSRYNGNPKYFGGIVAFTRKDFIKINGFPNNFWGCVRVLMTASLRALRATDGRTDACVRWGGEDDELYCRVLKKKLTIESPPRCSGSCSRDHC